MMYSMNALRLVFLGAVATTEAATLTWQMFQDVECVVPGVILPGQHTFSDLDTCVTGPFPGAMDVKVTCDPATGAWAM